MREIKFRLWNDIEKKWELGYDLPNLGGFSILGETMVFGEYLRVIDKFSLEDWDKIKITQFIGLKDKNGKEIYEGDIVKPFIDESTIAQIIFMGGAFRIASKKHDGSYFLWNYFKECIEVVGNIYENPELLNQ